MAPFDVELSTGNCTFFFEQIRNGNSLKFQTEVRILKCLYISQLHKEKAAQILDIRGENVCKMWCGTRSVTREDRKCGSRLWEKNVLNKFKQKNSVLKNKRR